jgi:hypothetical protein
MKDIFFRGLSLFLTLASRFQGSGIFVAVGTMKKIPQKIDVNKNQSTDGTQIFLLLKFDKDPR